jgi:phosphoribosylanthranilate isomerase
MSSAWPEIPYEAWRDTCAPLHLYAQIGVTHSWDMDRKIVESVRVLVIIAGGLGSDNVVNATRTVQPSGADSKTKTDKDDGSHTKDLHKVRRLVTAAKSLVR